MQVPADRLFLRQAQEEAARLVDENVRLREGLLFARAVLSQRFGYESKVINEALIRSQPLGEPGSEGEAQP